MTLTLGRSYLPLAVLGLDALEMWAAHVPARVMQPHYAALLPCLDVYLQTSSDTGARLTAASS